MQDFKCNMHVMLINRRKNYKEYRVVSLHVLYA